MCCGWRGGNSHQEVLNDPMVGLVMNRWQQRLAQKIPTSPPIIKDTSDKTCGLHMTKRKQRYNKNSLSDKLHYATSLLDFSPAKRRG